MRQNSRASRSENHFRTLVCPHVGNGLPRLYPGAGFFGVAANLAGLLFCGVLGAGLLHLAAYHLRTGSTAVYLLQHCPWRPVLLVVIAFAVFNALIFGREIRQLWRERDRLTAGLQIDESMAMAPRHPARLAGLFLCLYLIEVVATALAMRVAPMRAPMLMGGHTMLMPVTPIFPMPVGQIVIAGLLAVLLWRFERRVCRLRRIVGVLRRLLALLAPPLRGSPCVRGYACRAPRALYGFCIFSRPPPTLVGTV